MILIINGNSTEVKEGLTVEGLLKELDIEPGRVAVEVNVNIIKKVNYKECLLKDGDSVEIVNFVGGG
jgi:sulfur carrier protein